MGQAFSISSFICVCDRLTSWHCSSHGGIDGGDAGVVLMLPVVAAVEEEVGGHKEGKTGGGGGRRKKLGKFRGLATSAFVFPVVGGLCV